MASLAVKKKAPSIASSKMMNVLAIAVATLMMSSVVMESASQRTTSVAKEKPRSATTDVFQTTSTAVKRESPTVNTPTTAKNTVVTK